MTINPVSIFSGNVASLGLKQGCSAETELSLPSGSVLVRFFKLQTNEVKSILHLFFKPIFYQFCFY
jgi:hypothetical protein